MGQSTSDGQSDQGESKSEGLEGMGDDLDTTLESGVEDIVHDV